MDGDGDDKKIGKGERRAEGSVLRGCESTKLITCAQEISPFRPVILRRGSG